MGAHDHWESVHRAKGAERVSWYRPHLERSLEFLRGAGLPPDAAIIDVGGGASTFVDDLLSAGHANVTVLDISESALAVARERLGPRGAGVRWIAGDVTTVELPERAYDFWHDRAVFHFLVEEEARRRYVAAVRRALKPGGHIVVATFGPEGPEKCSGLDVARYDADALHGQFGAAFRKVASATEQHVTPWGAEQEFVYCYCRLPG
jgi:ubiquinone/menaquinone biosynthesis C-methylase UbiE